MASVSFRFLILCSIILSITFPVTSQASFRPKALVLPVTKDSSTLQYLTALHQRTPLVPVKLTLDLGGRLLWVDCDQGYSSSSYSPAHCGSSQCSFAGSNSCVSCFGGPLPGCNNNTCGLTADSIMLSMLGEVAQDVVAVRSTDGSRPGPVVSVPKFLFTCGDPLLLQGLPSGVKGMAGLGRTRISLPSQFSASFSFDRKFAICLSSSLSFAGAAFFGGGPYMMLSGIDVSKSLIYTPLIINPVSTAPSYIPGEPSSEYFIGVNSIKVNGKQVPLNASLLSIDKDGNGGTKISTMNPYTAMQTSIYKVVVGAFVRELSQVPRVAPVKPFGACFDLSNITSTRVGPGVPQIGLVLQSSSVVWTMFGANSMVQAKEGVLCLAFVDGGLSPMTSIVIGGHQLEDNLLQFDLAASRLGFSSSLLSRQTTCSNFNFTTKA